MIITVIVLLRLATHRNERLTGNRANTQRLAFPQLQLVLQSATPRVMGSIITPLHPPLLHFLTINYSLLDTSHITATLHSILTDVNMVILLAGHRVSNL